MTRQVKTKAAGMLLLIGLICADAGCGTKYNARAVVKGKVTIGEKHLTAGTVAFFADGNRSGSGRIDEEGNYTISDAPIGDCKVTVSVPKMGMAGMMGAKKDMAGSPTKMQDPNDPEKNMTAPAIDPKKIVPIPDKYADAATSGLTFKVEKGDNTFDIKLTP